MPNIEAVISPHLNSFVGSWKRLTWFCIFTGLGLLYLWRRLTNRVLSMGGVDWGRSPKATEPRDRRKAPCADASPLPWEGHNPLRWRFFLLSHGRDGWGFWRKVTHNIFYRACLYSIFFRYLSITEVGFCVKTKHLIADCLPFLSRQTLKLYHLLTLLWVNFFQDEIL